METKRIILTDKNSYWVRYFQVATLNLATELEIKLLAIIAEMQFVEFDIGLIASLANLKVTTTRNYIVRMVKKGLLKRTAIGKYSICIPIPKRINDATITFEIRVK